MNVRARLVNGIWTSLCRREHHRFQAALADPAAAQRRLLRRYLAAGAGTAWGRDHGLARMRSAADFTSAHPLTSWRDYEPYVARIMAGEKHILTRDRVRLLEPSSGSTAACKLVPYTARLQGEFKRAISAWVHHMFSIWPQLHGGPAYWAISPAGVRAGTTESRVPVGFADDSAYLGGLLGRLVSAVLAVPAEVRHIDRMAAFRYATLLHLLRARDLRLISVWHPSYLELLMAALPEQWETLLRDLAEGTLTPPVPLTGGVHRRLTRAWSAQPRRARELSRLDPAEPSALWPRLQLISCWADGRARGPAQRLRELFPRVSLQAKGLIATEAVVTLPYAGRTPLAVRSHVFEFLTPDGRILTADQLTMDGEYAVVVTTGGGLYRYRLGDRVRVDGFVGRTPSLLFLGKEDQVSDLCGEKLSEGFVAAVLDDILGGAAPPFAMLAPDTSGPRPGYTLYVQGSVPDGLAGPLEAALLRNPHYRYCRDLSQLRAAAVRRLAGDVQARYLRRCVELGRRLGDVKPVSLSPRDDWGRFLVTDERPCEVLEVEP